MAERIMGRIEKAWLRLALILVRFYQVFLSPLMGNNCRFHPSCSQYCTDALKTHGPIKGLKLTFRRIFSCHPFNQGGFDPVPDKE